MKKLAAVMLALLIAGVSTGAVFAYLTSQDSVNNKITAANTDIRITEKFDPPGELNPGTVIPKTTQADGKKHYIVPITSNCTITASETWMFDPEYGGLHVNYESPSPDDVTETVDTEVGKVTLNSKNGWSARFENLEISDGITYTIKEMSVDGYTASYTLNNEALEADASFGLGQNSGSGDTIVITNTAEKSDEYELPSTGGAGTTPYTAVGGAIALAALVCGLCKKRRRERRAPN